MTKLENHMCCSDHQTCCADKKQSQITLDFKGADEGASEVLAPQLGNISARTRVTSRRVTKTTRSLVTGKQVTLVNSSGVTTTWSRSGPGIENLASDLDGHTELSFDLLNKIPTSGDLFGWVNDLYAFIEDQNVGLQKQKVGAESSGARDSAGENQVPAVNSGLNNETCKEEDKNPAASNGAAWAELLNVCHSVSFSHMEASQ